MSKGPLNTSTWKDKIRLGVYSSHIVDELDEQQVIDLVDAGIEVSILGFDRFIPHEQRMWLLDLYEKHGAYMLLYDRNIMSPMEVLGKSGAMLFDKEKAAEADWYKDHPAFAGNSFVDEPGTLHFEKLGQTVEDYKALFPDKIPYINLLPMYANNSQLTGGAWMDQIDYYESSEKNYRHYLAEYVRLVDTEYIGVDIYPCFTSDGVKTTYGDYCKAIELCADACRDSGRDFWVCVQTCSWHPSVRIPDEKDFRWQMYTMLAFGAKAMFYYVYADRPKHEGTPYGTGHQKRELWYASKRMAKEISKISDAYMSYRWVGAMNLNCSDETPYLSLYSPLASFAPVKDIASTGPVLIGCMEGMPEKGADGNALVLVNMSDPATPSAMEIKLQADGTVTAYIEGDALVLQPDAAGYVSLPLAAGEGVFLTINK